MRVRKLPTGMGERIKVVIADDHEIVRDGLRMILEGEDDFEVVGEAANGAEAVKLIENVSPDVALMDVRMPGVDGLKALAMIREKRLDVSVVVLTTYDEDQLVREALKAGAQGYLLKDTDRQALFRTIRAAARGETLLAPDVMDRLMNSCNDGGDGRRRVPGSRLTMREREILEAITRGERSREIASQFGITERTVKAHLASVYSKLGVQSRAGAVARALRDGLVRAD